MKYSEEQKQQVRNWVHEGLLRIAVYMETTLGFPHEAFNAEVAKMPTLGEQIIFIASFKKKYPKLFNDMPKYNRL